MNVSCLSKEQCSGCGLCVNICPKKCIRMKPDELGFVYPVIDSDNCIDCGLCYNKCIIQTPIDLKAPIETYAAVRSDSIKLSQSSSGGVFAAIAESVIPKGNWVVAGARLSDSLLPEHCIVTTIDDLSPLYGSKYVQSATCSLFPSIRSLLSSGVKVLFSGTPCQVASLKRFTNNHVGLYTIDVICHGVPNQEMFLSYLDMYDKNNIDKFIFRDKGQGWSFNNKISYKDGQYKLVNHRLSSYMTYFLNGETYRESCYACPYACSKRGADITIGDFWGIVRKREDLKEKIDIEKGVSCLIVNTEKGKELLEDSPILFYKVDYRDIKEGNEPLNHPSVHTSKRQIILNTWGHNHTWRDVDDYWRKNDCRLVYRIWNIVPFWLQHKIRVLLGKR